MILYIKSLYEQVVKKINAHVLHTYSRFKLARERFGSPAGKKILHRCKVDGYDQRNDKAQDDEQCIAQYFKKPFQP